VVTEFLVVRSARSAARWTHATISSQRSLPPASVPATDRRLDPDAVEWERHRGPAPNEFDSQRLYLLARRTDVVG
jgi:hypothetical protein